MLRAPAPPPRRWRNASKQTTAQATPTLSDSARPAMGMTSAPSSAPHRRRVEPGGLVAEEEGRGHGPVETGIVLAVAHDRRPACGSRRPTARWPARPGRPARRGGRGRASRPRRARSWGCRGRRSRRRRRPPSTPEASAARSTVPALPGSRTSTRTTISEPGRARHASASAGGSSSMGRTASTGWGVTVSATRSSTPAAQGEHPGAGRGRRAGRRPGWPGRDRPRSTT